MRINCGNTPTKISDACFDASHGGWQESVVAALRESRSTTRLWTLKAFGVRNYRPQKTDLRQGRGWRIAQWPRLGNVIVVNADYWRRNMQQGWLVESTEAGAMSLYEGDRGEHAELASQIAGERLIEYVMTAQAEFYRWERTPGVPNDRADAAVYACALLALSGIGEPLQQRQANKTTRRIRHVSI